MNAGDLYSKGCNIRLRRLQYSLETTFVHVKGRPAVTARTFTVKRINFTARLPLNYYLAESSRMALDLAGLRSHTTGASGLLLLPEFASDESHCLIHVRP
jgi:hypothetical protein